ncbi:MAG TPA: hypothetical protein VES00_10915 [Burkholderiaceae bacterium]|jgi:hypothetical protein|nr:hypothetical protein [Burkholderiaceae bacterium]
MNAAARKPLADHSQLLVHYAAQLMGVLTQPPQSQDPLALGTIAGHATVALQTLRAEMISAPELAEQSGTIQRFDAALCDWRRSVIEESPHVTRYQTALLQQAAQVVNSGLDVAAWPTGASARRRTSHAGPDRRR